MAIQAALKLVAFAAANFTPLVAAQNYSDPDWVFSIENNGPSTLDRRGGPVLVYNGTGSPRENITSAYPHVRPFPDDVLANSTIAQLQALYADTSYASNNNCTRCITALQMGKTLAMAAPNAFPSFRQQLCLLLEDESEEYCMNEYGANPGRGLNHAMVFQRMQYETGDMDFWCISRFSVDECSYPTPITINEDDWFSTPKPANATAPPPSGETFKAIHFSDWHYDPRYSVGSEANCTSGSPCCRTTNWNEESPTTPLEPASRFGDYTCDTPADLGLSAFQNMRETLNLSEVGMAIFTGDLVSHDAHWELSDSYTTYTEVMSYLTFKAQLGEVPVYAALGNHDSNPTDMAAANSPFYPSPIDVNDFMAGFSLVSSMWAANNWIPYYLPEQARTHYGAYSVSAHDGKLQVITFNTDFWFLTNIYNYVDMTNPDLSGAFKFLISELEAAEAAGQRVWIIGHVPSGYDGSSTVDNPSTLFYSIVQRFSPHVIAAIFFGHTHSDQMNLYYDAPVHGNIALKNQSNATFTPINAAWIGPSIVPISTDNPAWRYYDIDSKTFSVINSYTYFSNISDTSSWTEPVWQFEYSAREVYDDPAAPWPAEAPLNATWWEGVVERMAKNESGLVQTYNKYLSRQVPGEGECVDSSCIADTVCWIRSGSAVQGREC